MLPRGFGSESSTDRTRMHACSLLVRVAKRSDNTSLAVVSAVPSGVHSVPNDLNALRTAPITTVALRRLFSCRCIIGLSGSQDEAFSGGVSHANDINSSKFAGVNGTTGKDLFVRRPRSFSRRSAFGMGTNRPPQRHQNRRISAKRTETRRQNSLSFRRAAKELISTRRGLRIRRRWRFSQAQAKRTSGNFGQ